ncbi:MAG: hypothetical protein AAFP19_20245 [Bacteroidota bacterium]
MTTLIIALLMSLGIIATPEDYHNMTPQEQQEAQEIVIEDILTM